MSNESTGDVFDDLKFIENFIEENCIRDGKVDNHMFRIRDLNFKERAKEMRQCIEKKLKELSEDIE